VDEKLLQVMLPGTSGYMIGKAIDLNYGTDEPSVRDLHFNYRWYSKSRLLSGKGIESISYQGSKGNACQNSLKLEGQMSITKKVMAQCYRSSHLF
jgi:hypothetical protein